MLVTNLILIGAPVTILAVAIFTAYFGSSERESAGVSLASRARFSTFPPSLIPEPLPPSVRLDSRGRLVFAETLFARVGRCVFPHAPAFWLAVGAVIALVVNSTLLLVEKNAEHGISMTLKSLAIGLVPLVLALTLGMLSDWAELVVHFVERPPDVILEWLAREMGEVTDKKKMVEWGLVFGVVVCGLESFDGAFRFQSVWTILVVLSASFISTSFAGMAVYVMSRGTVLISRVGGFPLHVTSHGFGVLSTGKFLVKAYG